MLPLRHLAALLILAAVASAALARPNFILFIADDMAWEDCGAYGNQAVHTPHFDNLLDLFHEHGDRVNPESSAVLAVRGT